MVGVAAVTQPCDSDCRDTAASQPSPAQRGTLYAGPAQRGTLCAGPAQYCGYSEQNLAS